MHHKLTHLQMGQIQATFCIFQFRLEALGTSGSTGQKQEKFPKAWNFSGHVPPRNGLLLELSAQRGCKASGVQASKSLGISLVTPKYCQIVHQRREGHP